MANLKFYRKSTAPANPVEGAIWFNTTDKTINVYKGTEWEKYAGKLSNATWDDAKQKLTISKNDGSSIELDFSDMASATSVNNVLGKYADPAKNDASASIHARINQTFLDINGLKGNLSGDDATTLEAINDELDSLGDNIANIAVTASGDDELIDASVSDKRNVSISASERLIAAVELAESSIQSVESESESHHFIQINTSTDENKGVLISASANTHRVEDAVASNNQAGTDKTDGLAVASNVKSYVDGSISSVVGSTDDTTESMTIHGLDKRLDTIEVLLAEDGDDVINNLKDVIDYFAEVKETDTGAALISTVSTLDESTINGKKINESPVLAGSDIKITGYTKATAADLTATDTINTALGKLEARVDAAAAGGVQSFGGKTGSITVKGGQAANGSVNLAMSDNELQASIVGLGSAAYTESTAYATAAQGTKADSAIQSIVDNADNDTGVSYIQISTVSGAVSVNVKTNEDWDTVSNVGYLADVHQVKQYVDNKIHNEIAWAEFE